MHTQNPGRSPLEQVVPTSSYGEVIARLRCFRGIDTLSAAGLAGIVVTDTVPIDPIAKPDNMTVLSVAPLLAETIMNVFADDSVSAIFGGENQLF